MKDANELFQEIIEGDTKLLVPKKSLTEKVPPIKPAFFNPKAKTNRDFSIIAYAAFLKKIWRSKNFLGIIVRSRCKRITCCKRIKN